jgi:hypothetical protein
MLQRLRSRFVGGGLSLLLIAGFLPLTTAGCFGGFELTRKVYDFNKDIDPNKWVRWLAFLGMNILPVYGFAVIIDAIFANSIEFWTGDNPILAAEDGETRTVRGPAGETIQVTKTGPGMLHVQAREVSGGTQDLTLVFADESLTAYAADGSLLGRVGDQDGELTLLAGLGVSDFSAVR